MVSYLHWSIEQSDPLELKKNTRSTQCHPSLRDIREGLVRVIYRLLYFFFTSSELFFVITSSILLYFTQYRCKPYLIAMNLSVLLCTFLPTSMYLVFEGCLWIKKILGVRSDLSWGRLASCSSQGKMQKRFSGQFIFVLIVSS